MICTKNLTKTFTIGKSESGKKEKIVAVDHINLEIKKGEIFGLIGPTGAGKTTTIKMLSTLILPDEGTATINGYDVVEDADIVKNQIGVLAGEFTRTLYLRLSGNQNLIFFAKLRNMFGKETQKRISYLLELFNLKKWESNPVMKYSTGMKHKLALAIALLNDPPILFLDEPLVGIDPIAAQDIKGIVKGDFRDKTVIWASHNLYEIEEMCDRIGLMNNGKIVLEGNPGDLKRKYWNYEKIRIVSNDPCAFNHLKNVDIRGNIVEIRSDDLTKTLIDIVEIAKKTNSKLLEIQMLKPTLQEVFVSSVKNVK